jgi:hypothetical protein
MAHIWRAGVCATHQNSPVSARVRTFHTYTHTIKEKGARINGHLRLFWCVRAHLCAPQQILCARTDICVGAQTSPPNTCACLCAQASPNIQVATITEAGVDISAPYQLSHYWGYKVCVTRDKRHQHKFAPQTDTRPTKPWWQDLPKERLVCWYIHVGVHDTWL